MSKWKQLAIVRNIKTWTSNFVSSKITEHVKLKGGRKSATPDYSKLLNDTIYVHRILGNIMFNGKLIQASTNFGCFMTLSASPGSTSQIPESFKVRKWVIWPLYDYNSVKRIIWFAQVIFWHLIYMYAYLNANLLIPVDVK